MTTVIQKWLSKAEVSSYVKISYAPCIMLYLYLRAVQTILGTFKEKKQLNVSYLVCYGALFPTLLSS